MHATIPFLGAEELTPEQIALVRRHLKVVLSSPEFAGSKRAQEFLQLIVEHAIGRDFDLLKERTIGMEMFHRPADYDTANDSVVRVKATEVRKKLAMFYLETGDHHEVRIELHSGSYVPKFVFPPLAVTTDTAVPLSLSNSASGPEHLKEGSATAVTSPRMPFWKQMSRKQRLAAGILLCIACLAVVMIAIARRYYTPPSVRSEIRSIAVLPFENLSGNSQQDYFSDGMTEELIENLGQVSALRVISRTSSMSYKGTKKDLPEIARELSVEGIVEGAVLREGDQIRITVRLIDARTDHPIWTHSYVRDLTNIVTLQGELAQAIADEVSIKLTPQAQANLSRQRPVNKAAEDIYLQGMHDLYAGEFQTAAEVFQRAILADPDFAQAHAALATCYGRLGEGGWVSYADSFVHQESEAARAVELDNALPEAHVEMANAAMNLNWDWNTAAREFQKAFELNPNLATAHVRYSVYLERTGDLQDAIAEVERSMTLDPVSAQSFRGAAFTLFFARQYDRAFQLIKIAQARDVDYPNNTFLLGQFYVQKGMYAKAIGEFQKLRDNSHALGQIGYAYARAGQTEAAREIIRKLTARLLTDGVGRFEIALVYAGLGDKNEAFAWLEKSYQTHDPGVTYLKIDPCLDTLRSDPRFGALVSRVGFKP
jgi:TolB-like protein/Tfp pilus assembly protein PilF